MAEQKTFFKVRRPDGLFYNPNKSGNRIDPTFDKKGKRYYAHRHAEEAQQFCLSPVNTHWASTTPIKKTPISTEIVQFEEIVKEIGVVTA